MPAQTVETCCPVVELRQYTLHPGTRDVLIELFDREFVESQEVLGISVIGQFRRVDEPNRFVWLRGFRDMPSRARGLTDFYDGSVWKANREAANATMIDFGDVFLLRPARPGSGFPVERDESPTPGDGELNEGLVVCTIYPFDSAPDADFLDFFEREIRPVVTDTGAAILAFFVTEESANTYPALPVRAGEPVFVWFARFDDEAAYERHIARLERSPRWAEVSQELASRLSGPVEVRRLLPTARSRVR